MSANYSYNQAPTSDQMNSNHTTANEKFSQFEDDEENKSSLSKTIGNVMNLVNDGLYRFKNRAKAE